MNPVINSEKRTKNNYKLIYLDIYIKNTDVKVADFKNIQ